jgi:hypothetical protein
VCRLGLHAAAQPLGQAQRNLSFATRQNDKELLAPEAAERGGDRVLRHVAHRLQMALRPYGRVGNALLFGWLLALCFIG